ncbi:MAG TPA: glycosyltransferase family 25 protein [Allocoleopsis sp.]
MFDSVYVINLDKDTSRFEKVSQEIRTKLGKIPTRIKGIYGKDLSYEQKKKHCSPFYARIGSRSAIGCAMSHMKAWETMISNGDSDALILEDDVTISSNFLETFDKIKETIPKDFYIVYLGCVGLCDIEKRYDLTYSMIKLFTSKYSKQVIKINENVYVPALPLALHGYILSRKGAEYLLENIRKDKIKFHIDFQILKYLYTVPSYAISPQLIFQDDVDIDTSNNVSDTYPVLINSLLKKKDKQGIPSNYKLTIGHFDINDYTVNLYTYLAIILGIILGIFKVKLKNILIIFGVYHIPEWTITNLSTFKTSIITLFIILCFYLVTVSVSR